MKRKSGFILLIILQLFLYVGCFFLDYLNTLRSITYNNTPYLVASTVFVIFFGLLMGLAACYGFQKENLILLIILLLLNIGAVITVVLLDQPYFLHLQSFFLILAGFMFSGIIKIKIKK